MEKIDSIHLKLKHPFNMTIAGPSACGKTSFVRNLLAKFDTVTTIDVPRLRVFWAHGQAQEAHHRKISDFVDVTYSDGIPSEERVLEISPHILIMDDLMVEAASAGKSLVTFLSRFSHHNNISIIYITQNLYFNGKNTCEANRQSHYTVVFRNSRDKSIAITLGKQLAPYNKRHFYESFHDATKKPFSYLLIDAHPTTPEELLLKTNIYSEKEDECTCDVYFENGEYLDELKKLHEVV